MRVCYAFKFKTRKITVSSYHPMPLKLNESHNQKTQGQPLKMPTGQPPTPASVTKPRAAQASKPQPTPALSSPLVGGPRSRSRRATGRSLGARHPDFEVSVFTLCSCSRSPQVDHSPTPPPSRASVERVLPTSTKSSNPRLTVPLLATPSRGPRPPAPPQATLSPSRPRRAVKSYLERNPDFALEMGTLPGPSKPRNRYANISLHPCVS